MAVDPAVAALFDAAETGDASASDALRAHFQALHPLDEAEPPPGAWPAPTTEATPPAWRSMAEGDQGLPPTASHYMVPSDLEEVAPAATAQLRSWALDARLSVAEVGEMGTHLYRLACEPVITDTRVLQAQGDALIGRLSGSPEGRQTLDRAQRAWRDLEHRCPQLAELLLDLNAPSDLQFVTTLAATVRR